ncbi:response regulator transcription factor [Accumulibacter sp.]|uniref:response regulator n=1 Tax=Accumulibacter sp. TaxID=2053492 RepID=UPI00261A1EB1|nr:response regulator transcription factor [Accumulibacter sp.]HMV58318.1 response regulator transcription factor [Nitrospira sp.]
MSIRVFLADDHRLLVEGFRHALKDFNIDVVEVAYSLEGLIDRYFEVKPDVLVIDVRFDSKNVAENGLDICEELLAKDPKAKIIVFSQFDDQYIIEGAYKIGALAFVLKDESTEILDQAIRTVAEGREFFSPQVAQLLARSSVKDRNPTKLLDEKELRAFLLTADGESLADVAEAMDLSTKTVGNLLKSIKAKLDIDTPADFTKVAIRFGLTTTELKSKS